MTAKIGIISLGCAKNLVNSEEMMWLMRQAGMEVNGETENTDAVLINTCGFIDSAKSEAIDTILEMAQLKAQGLTKKIIVAGCLAERYKEEIFTELPEVDGLIGCGSFNNVVKDVKSVLAGNPVCDFGNINTASVGGDGRIVTTPESWAYIKIADGCDNRCSFCVIPSLRGKYRSRDFDGLVDEAKALAAAGTKELIVIAQDITRYGTDNYGRRRLSDLIKEFAKIDGIEWIRLHYLYPDEMDDELIDTIAAEDKVVKYLDIPIQHINNKILKTMNRRGTGEEIRDLLKKLREKIPGVVIRTSIIAGLPGEGEAEFEELCDFLREYKIERAGVFPYSPEDGTPAAKMERPDSDTALRRAELIGDIQAEIMDEYNANRLGDEMKVLCEGIDSDGGLYYGRSYADSPDIDGKVYFEGEDEDIGNFVNIRITDIFDGDLFGEKL